MRLSVCRLRLKNGQSVDEQTLQRALSLLLERGLSQDEAGRICAKNSSAARVQSVGARLALLWALTDGEEAVHDFDDFPAYDERACASLALLGRSSSGAPLLRGRTEGISFAHCETASVCAYSRDGAIGVDVEPLSRRLLYAADVADRYFSEGEQALLTAAGEAYADTFLRIWTRKEALGKKRATGLQAPAWLLDTCGDPSARFHEYEYEGCVVCVCQ